jgi:hypothetical protein
VPEGPIKPAIYVGASDEDAQGNVKVFFVTETELTRDDAGRDTKPASRDPELYEYDTATGHLTRVSAGRAGTAGSQAGSSGARVYTVPAISADGSAVYFTAFGQLVQGIPALDSPSSIYLYRYDVQSDVTTYIATIGTEDYPSEITGSWWGESSDLPKEVALNLEHANWYTTPDGEYLLFNTTRELVAGHTTAGPCFVAGGSGQANGHCGELYRYHYEPSLEGAASIVCVSCSSSGASPVSDAEFMRSTAFGASGDADGPLIALSDDGKTAFFDSADPLVPQAGNHTLNVYEWHEGQLSLISSGADTAPSFFLGADKSARDVFFGTHSQLVPQDTNSDGDIYDARLCDAAEPCIRPPSVGTAQCEGDACHPPGIEPIDTTPVSLTFAGAGNLRPPVPAPKCKKGTKLSHGKCVKKRPKGSSKKKPKVGSKNNKKRKASKSSNKGGVKS